MRISNPLKRSFVRIILFLKIILAGSISLLATWAAHADVIAEYNFTGGTVTSFDAESNSTAVDFKATGVTDIGFSGSGGNAYARSQILDGPDEAAAITAGVYFSFTVSADAEYDLTSLTYSSIHNATYSGGTAADESATMNFFVRSSVDNYATTVGSVFSQAWNTTTDNRTINLSGAEFQDLTNAVTFRLYAYESVALETNQGARWDNVVLNGTVVQPTTLDLVLNLIDRTPTASDTWLTGGIVATNQNDMPSKSAGAKDSVTLSYDLSDQGVGVHTLDVQITGNTGIHNAFENGLAVKGGANPLYFDVGDTLDFVFTAKNWNGDDITSSFTAFNFTGFSVKTKAAANSPVVSIGGIDYAGIGGSASYRTKTGFTNDLLSAGSPYELSATRSGGDTVF